MFTLKDEVFTAMQNAIDNGYTFMGATDLAIAEDLKVYCSHWCGFVNNEAEELARYVREFIWKPEVDIVIAFIKEGNYKAADERIKMWLPDVQNHIYMYLPTNLLLDLNAYCKTK